MIKNEAMCIGQKMGNLSSLPQKADFLRIYFKEKLSTKSHQSLVRRLCTMDFMLHQIPSSHLVNKTGPKQEMSYSPSRRLAIMLFNMGLSTK